SRQRGDGADRRPAFRPAALHLRPGDPAVVDRQREHLHGRATGQLGAGGGGVGRGDAQRDGGATDRADDAARAGGDRPEGGARERGGGGEGAAGARRGHPGDDQACRQPPFRAARAPHEVPGLAVRGDLLLVDQHQRAGAQRRHRLTRPRVGVEIGVLGQAAVRQHRGGGGRRAFGRSAGRGRGDRGGRSDGRSGSALQGRDAGDGRLGRDERAVEGWGGGRGGGGEDQERPRGGDRG